MNSCSRRDGKEQIELLESFIHARKHILTEELNEKLGGDDLSKLMMTRRENSVSESRSWMSVDVGDWSVS